MSEKDHIVEPLQVYEDISHTQESETGLKNEKIPNICKLLDAIVFKIGTVISWLSVFLIAIIVIQVFLRYAFNINYIQLEELQWHLYAIIVMFGLSYAMVNHSHVRVDIVRIKFSTNLQRKVEIIGILFLMVPFMFIVIDFGTDLTMEALRVNERSNSPDGLPYRWIIKSVMPISFILLFMASVSRLIRHVSYLMKGSKNGN
ncbi:MAG: TRAP transporter small permease subunit [Campylobacteraceae bacterium]|nr:TRAP transporter small permease subunit [Campylobacteraceae bacterium]